jgi:serine/threonine-protein kinase
VEGTPFGRYQLLSLLGRGGMGEVWRAHDTMTDRVVAMKLLPGQYSDDPTFQQRFRREAHAVARLNSPHVIPIHDYGEIDGRLYVTMRLVEGRDLQAVIAEGPMQPPRAVRIIEQVAKALHAAHRVGLVHRDVKPSNVLLDEDDFAYLIDFGIARATDDTRMTSTGNAIGTFQYMAPERMSDTPDDARADTYALACVLYECLTGQTPFTGSNMASLMYAHVHVPPPRPSATKPDVPQQFDGVIATGMAKDPDQRYATAIELSMAAQEAITAPVAQPMQTPAAPTPPAEQRIPPRSSSPSLSVADRCDAPDPANQDDGYSPVNQSDGVQSDDPRSGLDVPRRPRSVTIAAVLGFVTAAMRILAGALQCVGAANAAWGSIAMWYALGALNFIIAPVIVWGALAALEGKRSDILTLSALAVAVMEIVGVIGAALNGGQTSQGAVALIIAVAIVRTMRSTETKEYFAPSGSGYAQSRRAAATPQAPKAPPRRPTETHAGQPPPILSGVRGSEVDPAAATRHRPPGDLSPQPSPEPIPTPRSSSRRTVLLSIAAIITIAAVVAAVAILKSTSSGLKSTSADRYALPFPRLNNPDGIAVDSAGALYVVDTILNQVLKLPADSTSPQVLAFTGLSTPTRSVAVDSAGTVYVTDAGNSRVLKLEANSTNQEVLPFSSDIGPHAVAVDSAGTSMPPTSSTPG